MRAPGIFISCDHEAVPEDNTNLAYQAADLFFSKLGRRPAVPLSGNTEGLSVTIKKNIPVAAGLGGGSSNAATVLAALNTMYSTVSSRSREIATLRALGFGAAPVLVSVLLEALVQGLAGGDQFNNSVRPFHDLDKLWRHP